MSQIFQTVLPKPENKQQQNKKRSLEGWPCRHSLKNYGSDAIVVYWLAHLPSKRRVECSNPVWGNQLLLVAKAVYRTQFGTRQIMLSLPVKVPCPIIDLSGQKPAGSCAPMVLNYNRCVVSGSGPA